MDKESQDRDQVRKYFAFSDGETEVTVKLYKDGDVMLKQGDALVLVPFKLLQDVMRFMVEG